MSEFEKWLEENYPIAGLDMCEKEGDRYTHKPTRNMHDAYLAGQQSKEAAIKEMDEVIKLQDTDLRKYEKQIESLKEQLNNMEACYIEKKKQVETVGYMLEGDLKYVEQDRRGNFDFLQMAMIRCLGDALKALRGAND